MLHLGGTRRVTCFPVRSPDGAGIRQTLLSLYRRGIVKNEEEKFTPAGYWGAVFRQLYISPRLYWLTNADEFIPEVLIYAGAGENFIVLENISVQDSGRYRLTMLPKEELTGFLTDNGSFPEIHLEEEDRYEIETTRLSESLSGEGRLILTVRVYANGETEERQQVLLERRGALICCEFRENGMTRLEAAVRDTAARIIY